MRKAQNKKKIIYGTYRNLYYSSNILTAIKKNADELNGTYRTYE